MVVVPDLGVHVQPHSEVVLPGMLPSLLVQLDDSLASVRAEWNQRSVSWQELWLQTQQHAAAEMPGSLPAMGKRWKSLVLQKSMAELLYPSSALLLVEQGLEPLHVEVGSAAGELLRFAMHFAEDTGLTHFSRRTCALVLVLNLGWDQLRGQVQVQNQAPDHILVPYQVALGDHQQSLQVQVLGTDIHH